jgi:hypothetical protein
MNERGLWKWSISLCGRPMKGTLREDPFLGTPKDIISKALEMGVSFHRDPFWGNMGGRSVPKVFERRETFLFFIRRTFIEVFERHLK